MVFPPVPVSNYVQILVAEAVAARVTRFSPLGFQSGGDTWFNGTATYVLTDPASWEHVWELHIQSESIGNLSRVGNLNPPPAVDFDKSVVVALFTGTDPGVVGYQVVGGFAFGRQATLRLAPVIDPQPNARVAVPRPWAFILLPRSKGTVDIQVPKDDGWTTILRVKPTL